MQYFAGSDRGLVRRENEDSYLLYIPDNADILASKGILAIVADGVGGGPAGEKASSEAVIAVKESYYSNTAHDNPEALQISLEAANARIFRESIEDRRLSGMATTCTAFVAAGGLGLLCHAGDSRAYLLRGRCLRCISRDDTLVQELLDAGLISSDEGKKHPQRNIILKAVGSSPHLSPSTSRYDLMAGDTILLCTDGLHGYVTDQDISAVLLNNPVDVAGRKLIRLALDMGGADNITVVAFSI
ncbi:MAG TPA: protein phosphatase 2C domain-containing protein [Dissulfurispiraceae bacterium]|nr:protein phosphatase 2C domain-containing protein [Dissulfurispiraceae bacterium]